MGGTLNVGKVVFLGAGNMAEALVAGLVRGGVCPAENILVTDIRPERLKYFKDEFGVSGMADNTEAVSGAGMIIFAVKPQVMGEVVDGLVGVVSKETLCMSIAAGIKTSFFEERLGEGTRVVRVMPNTPALVQAGAAALAPGKWAMEADMDAAETVMKSVGCAVRVEEKDIDAVTALSGSGPAYVFYLMEAMLKAAAELGLDDAVARELTYATVAGAAKLISETGVEAGELRARVTSKGGTTAAAIEVLNSKGVSDAIVEALRAAHRRSLELSGS